MFTKMVTDMNLRLSDSKFSLVVYILVDSCLTLRLWRHLVQKNVNYYEYLTIWVIHL